MEGVAGSAEIGSHYCDCDMATIERPAEIGRKSDLAPKLLQLLEMVSGNERLLKGGMIEQREKMVIRARYSHKPHMQLTARQHVSLPRRIEIAVADKSDVERDFLLLDSNRTLCYFGTNDCTEPVSG
jgi:hypothetical protein